MIDDKKFEELSELLADTYPEIADQIHNILYGDRCKQCEELGSLTKLGYCRDCSNDDERWEP